ncbi:MAG: hypothetical protein RLZZ301_93 [Bacteroidota bacterium]|jgi:hypothetical protein
MTKRFISLLFCIASLPSLAQQVESEDYVVYQRTINRIDADVLAKNYSTAIQRFDSLYENFEFVYSKHCLKALQICCVTADTVHAKKWLEKSIKQGVPLWMLQKNELTNIGLQFACTQEVVNQYDSLRFIYQSSVRQDIRKTIDSLYEWDQRYTQKVNDGFILLRYTTHYFRWLQNNKRQFETIKAITETYGFPGEKLIGLPSYFDDSTQLIKRMKVQGPILGETNAYIMLIHYFSKPRLAINDVLLKSVLTGYLPAYQFGAFNDFLAKWGKGNYGNYQFYNVWHTDKNPANAADIDMRRQAIGLNTYEMQQQLDAIYDQRVKLKTGNKEIVLD